MTDETTATSVPSAASTVTQFGGGMHSPEYTAAEKAVAAIMTGVKNFGVFPPEHASTIGMLQGVLRTLRQFWERYGTLAFEVEKQSLVHQGKAVYDGPAGDDNPAYVLHRAGISRFEFAPGLEERELTSFFLLYTHFRVEADEPDDDLVSALWRAGLPHIFYEASYELWSESETSVDYDSMEAVNPDSPPGPEVTARPGKGWAALRLESTSDNYRKVSLALFPTVNAYCTLNPDEQAALARLVTEESSDGDSEAAVRLMFILLNRESEVSVLEGALGFLQEVYLDFLANRAFQRALFVLENIRKEALLARESKPQVLSAYKNFYSTVMRPEIIDTLLDYWPSFAEFGPVEVKALVTILQQVPGQVGGQILARLPKVTAPEARKLFFDLIVHQAKRDRELLVASLRSEDEALVLRMMALVKEMNDRNLVEQLLTKLRYDSRSHVRQEAMHILASYNIY